MMELGIGRWNFRPGLWPSLGALLLISLTVSLGNWQIRRAEEKAELGRRIDEGLRNAPLAVPREPMAAEPFELNRVQVRGEFAGRHTLFLDNKVYRGVAGYQVLTPLRIEGSEMHVLVNRGWVAGAGRRDVLPAIKTPSGSQHIEGIAIVPSGRFVELSSREEPGPVVQNLLVSRIAERTGLGFQPVVIQQTSAADDGLVREWQRPDTGTDKHRGYALQWYSLALLTALLYVGLNLKRRAADR
jgi:surfeit locus 1 family protein